ncbi:hypothetical protein WAJ74_21915, partial [Acinetobacter baumannii]
EFEGSDGNKTYELDNGSIWKLASYKSQYSYKYRRKAVIYRNNGSYYLAVEGMGEALRVYRL